MSAIRMSSMTWRISPFASPSPTISPDLVKIAGIERLHVVEQPQRLEVARAGADGGIQAGYRLEVVVEHVRPCRDDQFGRTRLAQEVRRQDLDRGSEAQRRGWRGSRRQCARRRHPAGRRGRRR